MEITSQAFFGAFMLTLLAGIATAIGAFLAFFVKRENKYALSFGLGISAGVMIYISFLEILPESKHFFEKSGIFLGFEDFLMVGSIALGMIISLIIDSILPQEINPDEPKDAFEMQQLQSESSLLHNKKLYRVGIITSIVIALHNIPEGLVTFLSTLVSFEIGLAVAFALALHKIPEGFAVSLPIYYATGNKLKAFILTSFSGMANLLGALLGYFFVQYFFSDFVLGMLFGVVAGIMLFVSFHQLLPTASQYNKHHIEVYGVLIGMILIGFIMAFLSKI